jgi:Protein of unknown function (DUF3106)
MAATATGFAQKEDQGAKQAERPAPAAQQDRNQPMPLHQGFPFMQFLRDLPPDQQERVLANNPRFKSLPPERQQQIRENLKRWNEASFEQRQVILQREEIVQSLSPEQRDELRQIFPRWRELPPGRRQVLMQNFRKLRDLAPADRENFLSSPELQQNLSSVELDILRSLNTLLPADAEKPAANHP